MAKNGKLTFNDLVKAYEVKTETVDLDKGHDVVVRELSGSERFEFSKFADAQEWETYRWLAFKGLLEPKPSTIDDLDLINPEWVVKIAGTVMKLSGITAESEEDAEKKSGESTGTGSSSRATSVAA